MRLIRRLILALLALIMLAGLFVPALEAAPASGALSFRRVLEPGSAQASLLPSADPTDADRLTVADAVLLSGSDVTCVGLAGAPDDAPAAGPNVRLVFDGAQRDQLTAVTTAHVGDRIALVLDGKVLMAPRLRDPITGGEVVVYGGPGWDAAALRDTIHRNAGVPLCAAP
jgi:SecD/SecF fusion protein